MASNQSTKGNPSSLTARNKKEREKNEKAIIDNIKGFFSPSPKNKSVNKDPSYSIRTLKGGNPAIARLGKERIPPYRNVTPKASKLLSQIFTPNNEYINSKKDSSSERKFVIPKKAVSKPSSATVSLPVPAKKVKLNRVPSPLEGLTKSLSGPLAFSPKTPSKKTKKLKIDKKTPVKPSTGDGEFVSVMGNPNPKLSQQRKPVNKYKHKPTTASAVSSMNVVHHTELGQNKPKLERKQQFPKDIVSEVLPPKPNSPYKTVKGTVPEARQDTAKLSVKRPSLAKWEMSKATKEARRVAGIVTPNNGKVTASKSNYMNDEEATKAFIAGFDRTTPTPEGNNSSIFNKLSRWLNPEPPSVESRRVAGSKTPPSKTPPSKTPPSKTPPSKTPPPTKVVSETGVPKKVVPKKVVPKKVVSNKGVSKTAAITENLSLAFSGKSKSEVVSTNGNGLTAKGAPPPPSSPNKDKSRGKGSSTLKKNGAGSNNEASGTPSKDNPRTKRPTYGDLDPNAMPDVYHTEMPEIRQGPIGKFIMGMLGSDEKKKKRNGNNGFRNK